MAEPHAPAQTVTEAFNAVNPNRALDSDDPRYVDFTEWRSPMPIADRLAGFIVRPSQADPPEYAKVLFTGHKGSGKSTELRRLAAKLEEQGFFVVYFDAATEIDMSGVSYADVLLTLMYRLVSAVRGTEVEDALSVEAVDALRTRLAAVEVERQQSQSSEGEFKSGMSFKPGIPGLFEILTRFSVHMKGGESEKRTLRDLIDADIGLFLEDLNLLIGDLQIRLREAGSAGLVVLVDSLDRVILKSISDDGRRTTHKELFIEHADHLMAPACSMVYTIPVSLLNDANVANAWGTRPELLPMVKVHERDDPTEDCDGALDAMVGAVARRIDLDAIFADPTDVRRLCRMSGGHLRDLMILLRDACSYTPDGQQISSRSVGVAIQDLINSYARQIEDRELDALVEVARTRQLPNREDCQRLPLKTLVLEYRNGTRWHDVHPAIREAPVFEAAQARDDGPA